MIYRPRGTGLFSVKRQRQGYCITSWILSQEQSACSLPTFTVSRSMMFKLAPDGAHVAIKYAHKNQQGVEQITIAVVHTQSSLRTDIDLPLPGTLNSCIVTASYNMAWSPASDALAFDLAQESKSTSACGTQKIFSGGLYITDINTGISKKVFTFDDTFRDYFPNPYPRSLGWFLMLKHCSMVFRIRTFMPSFLIKTLAILKC